MRDALKAARDALAECAEDTNECIVRWVESYGEKYKPGRLAAMQKQYADALAAIAQADAALAVVADERAAFEAWQHRIGLGNNQSARVAWKAWQARSRLGSHADVEDAARLAWIEAMVAKKSTVVIGTCGEELRLVQVRHFGDCTNYPVASGVRAAIDLARKEQT